MIRVSDRCYEQMQRRTNFQPVATVTLANGTVLNLTQADFTLGGNTIVDGAAANAVPLGVAVCKMVNLSLMNEDDRFSNYDFYAAKITLNARFPIHWTSASDTWETVYIGKFTVVTPKTPGSTITMTAADDMYKADRPYTSGLTYPATLRLIINDICTTMGVTPPGTFPNESFRIEKKPVDVSIRQVIGGVAGLAGGNAYMDRYGAMQIRRYDQSSISSVLSGLNSLTGMPACHVLRQWMRNPTVDTDDIVITGVKIEMDDDQSVLYGNQGYVLVIDNPLVSGQEEDAARLIGNAVNGLRFRQFIGSYIGYPIADFMDPAIVIDRKGNTYSTFLTDITYTFCGGTEFKNSAEPLIRNQNHQYSSGTRTLQKIRELVNRRVSAYDIGVQNLTQIMSLGLGLYAFKTENDDGSFTYIFGNHPTLEDSDTQWKVTAGGFAVSEDYGVTWASGLMANGTMLVKILTAIGIQADWITTGKLLAQDGQGNTIFMVDFDESDSARVEIHADAFTLSGQTIQQIAQSEASGAFQNLTQKQIFDILTNNSQNNGIHLINGVLYLDFSYAEGGTLKLGGENNGRGILQGYQMYGASRWSDNTAHEVLIYQIDSGGFHFNAYGMEGYIDWKKGGGIMVGSTSAIRCEVKRFSTDPNNTDKKIYSEKPSITENRVIDFDAYFTNNFSGTRFYGTRIFSENMCLFAPNRFHIMRWRDPDSHSSTGYTWNSVELTETGFDVFESVNIREGGLKLSGGSYANEWTHSWSYPDGSESVSNKEYRLLMPNGNAYLYYIDNFLTRSYQVDVNHLNVYKTVTFEGLKSGLYSGTTPVLAIEPDGDVYTITPLGSSKRYKTIRKQVTAEDIKEAYGINVYMATYKPGYLANDDQRVGAEWPMFVVEQMYEHVPIAVDMKDGQCETWNAHVIVPIMFQMIKDQKATIDAQQEAIDKQRQQLDEQQKRIDSLEERLRRLEEVR